jgi:PhzF family phenazine biosynthesis protein
VQRPLDLAYFVVDAFTSTPFTGNPAAVVPLDRWLPDALMQSIAAEMNLSETAFFAPEPGGDLRLRWFTPVTEVDLCGHATLASAAVLMTLLDPARRRAVFASRSGPLVVDRDGDQRWILDFPSRPPAPVDDPALLAQVGEALGARPVALGRARDLVAVFAHADEVRGLRPDFGRVAAVASYGLIATAPADGAGDGELDFVSRFFVPAKGNPEDPVTGSAHCTLTPYWAARLDRTALRARQVSARGGDLTCELVGDRVRLGGTAVLVARGTLRI